jgi:hypothetical protein
MSELITAPYSPAQIDEMHEYMDAIESEMAKRPEPPHETIHRFTPGFYWRTFVMPAGTQWTSKEHKTEHSFFGYGLCSVLNVLTGIWSHFGPVFAGVTKPGTRRLLVIHEKTAWTTCHPNPDNERDLSILESRLIVPRHHSLAIAEQRRLQ